MIRRAMRAIVALVFLAVFVAGAGARQTALPQQLGHVDLHSQANVEIRGGSPADEAGLSVAGVGDVDGDGLDDVVVGAPGADGNGRSNSGSAYVVFGRESPAQIDLAALGGAGYRIDGAASADRAGYAVAGLGDVNGDGRADVLVGAHGADNNGRSNSGSAYVVFGKSSGASVDLAALAGRGFRIDGAAVLERAGWSVAGAGDVNGDGLADVLVGAPFADNNLRQGSGSAYVVYGRRSSATVDLVALGDQGFRIDGAASQDFTSEAMAAAGDLNGDGLGDVLVGATFADNNDRPSSGSAHVVFGARTSATVDLAALGDRGFRIDGAAAGDGAGAAIAARDLNSDGQVDILVGAVFADNNGRQGSGSVYVLLGAGWSATVDLGALGDRELRIDGAAAFDFVGGSVAAPGDVDGDTRSDVLVGADGADDNGRHDSGSAYVVYLTGWHPNLDLGALGDRGFRIDGAGADDSASSASAGAGDVNGDSRADVLVGARGADGGGRSNSGSAYVVYGFGSPELAYGPLVGTVGKKIKPHAPRIVSRTGPPKFSVSRPLPVGLSLDPETGVVAGTPTVFSRRATYTVTMRDLAGSARAPLAVRIMDTSAPKLELGGDTIQNILRQRAVTVAASCSEPCRLSGRGSITVSRVGAVALRRARASLDAAGSTRLRLGLSNAARKRLARWLAGGREGRATVVVRAADRAGNTSTGRRTIAVRT